MDKVVIVLLREEDLYLFGSLSSHTPIQHRSSSHWLHELLDLRLLESLILQAQTVSILCHLLDHILDACSPQMLPELGCIHLQNN